MSTSGPPADPHDLLTPPRTVLVVDDEREWRLAVEQALARRGYRIEGAGTGEAAVEAVAFGLVDVVLLDLGLPDLRGDEVLRRVRELSQVPVIVVSAEAGQADKVALLREGADDYVTKPFGLEELAARIEAVLRRSNAAKGPPPPLDFGGIVIDRARGLVLRDGTPVRLTPTEYRLLVALASNPARLLTHEWLLRQVWGPGYGRQTEYLRTFMAQLRRKLGDSAADPRWIQTVPRVGYRWLVEPAR